MHSCAPATMESCYVFRASNLQSPRLQLYIATTFSYQAVTNLQPPCYPALQPTAEELLEVLVPATEVAKS